MKRNTVHALMFFFVILTTFPPEDTNFMDVTNVIISFRMYLTESVEPPRANSWLASG